MFKVKYQIEKGIFYVILTGDYDHTQTLGYLNIIAESKIKTRRITIIVDYRKAVLKEKSSQPIHKIGEFVNIKLKPRFNYIKWGSISVDYMFTTGALILKSLVVDDKLEMQPFSTVNALLWWTNLSECDFEDMVLLDENGRDMDKHQ